MEFKIGDHVVLTCDCCRGNRGIIRVSYGPTSWGVLQQGYDFPTSCDAENMKLVSQPKPGSVEAYIQRELSQ